MIRNNITFAICDFETTGVYPSTDYPIEVGIIFTDSNFIIKETFESFICHPDLKKEIEEAQGQWPNKYESAFKVHQIPAMDIIAHGQEPTVVTKLIKNLCIDNKVGRTPITILSDNAHFEYDFMRKLFTNEQSMREYFHYSAWDSNILTELTGVGDPIPVHRALPDCALLHQSIIRSVEKIGGFPPNKR